MSPEHEKMNVIPVFSRFFGSWHFSVGRRAYASNELENHYDKKSGVWQEKVDKYGFENAYQSLITRVLRQRRYKLEKRSLRVLDAGIGTGAMSDAFVTIIRRKLMLTGIDVSSQMLLQAGQKLAGRNILLRLEKADLDSIPLPNNSFDVVLVGHVLEHLAEPETVLAELFRVLKPGGLLIACITRRSLPGAYVQFLWRTHQVDMLFALQWLRQSGLQSVRAVPLDKNSRTRRLSIGYVGRKPNHAASFH